MFNSQRPNIDDLPTNRQLVTATAIAAVAAGVLLVTVVLPSEYAVDPTGIGRALGLTEMGEIKAQLAQEAELDVQVDAAARDEVARTAVAAASIGASSPDIAEPAPEVAGRNDEMSVTLAPGEGAEIKVTANKDARIAFAWSVDGGRVNYDTHGDPNDAPRGFYHGYGKGRASAGESGDLIAAFDGKHGWFWRNRSDRPVTVTLRTNGNYSEIRRVV